MQKIGECLPRSKILELNLLSKKFYNQIVPNMMVNLKMFPLASRQTYLFIKDNKIYAQNFNNATKTKEIDFEDDAWQHDNQYVFNDEYSNHPTAIIELQDLKDAAMLTDDEEILFQNVVQIDQNNILIFPLKDALKLEKCISVTFIKDEKPILKLHSLNIDQLNRPGIAV